jgi:protein-tyrosine phosphatase
MAWLCSILKEGVLFRSARVRMRLGIYCQCFIANKQQLDDASERDRRRLAEELHISTVLDLRSMYGRQSGVIDAY